MASVYEGLMGAEIRRLTVQPGPNHDKPIVCTLDTVSLDDSPAYEALSYVWGIEMASEPLSLEGTPTPITANLDVALRHLRHATAPRILWVDALCINQQDLDERAAQVRLMQTVYGKASGVLVWLGAAADRSDEAMGSIGRFDKEYWQTYEFQVQFMRILYRPWFTRIWVVQEFVLGADPKFGCGAVWVPWLSFIVAWIHFRDNIDVIAKQYNAAYRTRLMETFSLAWKQSAPAAQAANASAEGESKNLDPLSLDRILTSLTTALGAETLQQLDLTTMESINRSIEAEQAVWRARYDVMQYCQYQSPEAKAYFGYLNLLQTIPQTYHGFLMHARGVVQRQRKSLTFETILKGTMNLRSTDPRDKIYGMLGLVSEEARSAIPVDYKKPAYLTLVPTMAYILRHEPEGLALLSLLWKTRPFETPIPSWVPDFTISADNKQPWSPIFLRGSCYNVAWKGWVQDVGIDENDVVMTASGLSVGRVTSIVRFPQQGDMAAYVDTIRSIEPVVKLRCPDSEPLWRTLIGMHNTRPPPPPTEPSMHDRFEMLMGRGFEAEGGRPTSTSDARYAQKLFQEAMHAVIPGKAFFVTDTGFAGVATPDIKEGDLIAHIFGLVRPAVLRAADPSSLQICAPLPSGDYRRITGFCYVGCKARADFELQENEGWADWANHLCFRGQRFTKFGII